MDNDYTHIDFKTRGKVLKGTVNRLLNSALYCLTDSEVKNHIKKYLTAQGFDYTTEKELPRKFYAPIYYELKRLAEFDMMYDDDHPAFSPWVDSEGTTQPPRERRLLYVGWCITKDYYHDGAVNDDHWFTVHKQVKPQFETAVLNMLNQ